MELTAVKSKETGKWVVSVDLEEVIVKQDTRIGCAVRDVLNTVEYKYGEPASPIKVVIDEW